MSYLLKQDGKKFSAIIDGIACEGKIRVYNEEVFLLQNNKDGTSPSDGDHRGYSRSWIIYRSDFPEKDLAYFKISNLVIKDLIVSSSDGTKFRAKIKGEEVTGEIVCFPNEYKAFLLQNLKSGNAVPDNNYRGYKCSWQCEYPPTKNMVGWDVTDFEIISESDTKYSPIRRIDNITSSDHLRKFSGEILGTTINDGIVYFDSTGEIFLYQNCVDGGRTAEIEPEWLTELYSKSWCLDSSVTELILLDEWVIGEGEGLPNSEDYLYSDEELEEDIPVMADDEENDSIDSSDHLRLFEAYIDGHYTSGCVYIAEGRTYLLQEEQNGFSPYDIPKWLTERYSYSYELDEDVKNLHLLSEWEVEPEEEKQITEVEFEHGKCGTTNPCSEMTLRASIPESILDKFRPTREEVAHYYYSPEFKTEFRKPKKFNI